MEYSGSTLHSMSEVLQAVDEYFMGTSRVHQTADDLAARLKAEGIDFAIAGALALNAHGFLRATEDVDVLITREGLARFKATWLGRGYMELRPGGKPVRDTERNVKIDFLIAGEFPGDGKPKPVAFPLPASAAVDSDRFPVLSMAKLIELKTASGMTAPHRLHDLSDVARLIRERKLPLDFQSLLDPYVRAKFAELWQLAQVPDDEY